MYAYVLNAIGLILDITGAFMLIQYGSIADNMDFTSQILALKGESSSPLIDKVNKPYRKRKRLAIFFIVGGFILNILGVCIGIYLSKPSIHKETKGSSVNTTANKANCTI